jgi:hypothetical protein
VNLSQRIAIWVSSFMTRSSSSLEVRKRGQHPLDAARTGRHSYFDFEIAN